VTPEERLRDLGIELPPPPTPVASYVPVVVSGSFAFVSGMVPMEGGAPMVTGRLGAELSTDDGARWARRAALQALAALRAELGSLDRVQRIAKVTVWVASTDEFTEQPKVANGASDLLVDVFGDAGRHARAAVAAPVLPLGVPVEVEVLASISAG
jgi:enamine deaminase RidA (YjgF/YER057c/UK114 family)